MFCLLCNRPAGRAYIVYKIYFHVLLPGGGDGFEGLTGFTQAVIYNLLSGNYIHFDLE